VSKADLIVSTHKRTKKQLQRLQSLPLEQKVNLSLRRIHQFYIELDGKVYVGYSGGKDSTVLLHLVRRLFPEVKAVFCDTGVEFPGIKEFVGTTENVVILKPKMSFASVLKKYGFPLPSKEVAQKINEIQTTKSEKLRNKRLYGDEKGNGKLPRKWLYLLALDIKISHKCCDILKKNPSKQYERKTGLHPIIGTMAEESRLRESTWLRNGCNSFGGRARSTPMSFWTDKDVWEYIKKYNLPYASPYDNGEERTGCMFCLFGCSWNNDRGAKKFDRMKEKYPLHYKAAERWGIIDALNLIRPD